jgi:hypothetical protein
MQSGLPEYHGIGDLGRVSRYHDPRPAEQLDRIGRLPLRGANRMPCGNRDRSSDPDRVADSSHPALKNKTGHQGRVDQRHWYQQANHARLIRRARRAKARRNGIA